MSLQAPRGTQDILPDRTPAWQFLEAAFREVLARYGYSEIRTPAFEHTEVFLRGVGESTDIVQKEMYTFSDRGDRSLTLRPEGTAAVARAVVQHKLYAGGAPLRLYYLGPMFRYERPQAGRYRQHHQVGAELFGAESPAADFELIALLVDLLAAVGLSRTRVLLNSIGDAACRPGYSEAVRDYLRGRSSELCPDCVRRTEQNPLRVLDCKVAECRAVTREAPGIQEHLCEGCRAHQAELVLLLDRAGIAYRLDDRLVRGLDYYTRTVFEVQHEGLGAQNALGGGGRYDRLVEEVGGPPTPGVGFSSGLERLLLALEAEKVELPGTLPPQVVIVTIGEGDVRRAGLVLARRLRARFRVELDLRGRSLPAQMRAAQKASAETVLLVGEEELGSGNWKLKNMKAGSQESVEDAHLEAAIERILVGPAAPAEAG